MNLDQFTNEVASQFMEKIHLDPDTEFRNNDFFDSLTGMSILVMIKDKFNYEMDVSKFLKCKTPRDLFKIIIQDNDSK